MTSALRVQSDLACYRYAYRNQLHKLSTARYWAGMTRKDEMCPHSYAKTQMF